MKLTILHIFYLILLTLIHSTILYAQDKTCHLRLNVYKSNTSEYPLKFPIKNAKATLVDLSNNKILKGKTIDRKIFFSDLKEGRYNVVVNSSGYKKTSKYIRLDCEIVDEKKVYDEILFLYDGSSKKSVQMNSAGINVNYEPSPPPPPGSGKSEVSNFESEFVDSQFLNERATYLPMPKLTEEGKNYKALLEKSRSKLIVRVYVIADKTGKITFASFTGGRLDKSLAPDILEKAKQAKFLPFKINGKPSRFAGIIIYTF